MNKLLATAVLCLLFGSMQSQIVTGGPSCDSPTVLTTSNDTVYTSESNSKRSFWYSFQFPENGTYNMLFSGLGTDFHFYQNCEGVEKSFNEYNDPNRNSFDYYYEIEGQSGETILINIDEQLFGNSEIITSFSAEKTCAIIGNPVTEITTTGVYTADNSGSEFLREISAGDHYFKYTAERNGELFVTTAGRSDVNSFIRIEDNCNGLPGLMENDGDYYAGDKVYGQHAFIKFDVKQGEEYYIVLDDYHTDQIYDFEIGYTDAEGFSANRAIPVDVDTTITSISPFDHFYYTTSVEQAGVLVVYSNDSVNVQLSQEGTPLETNWNAWPKEGVAEYTIKSFDDILIDVAIHYPTNVDVNFNGFPEIPVRNNEIRLEFRPMGHELCEEATVLDTNRIFNIDIEDDFMNPGEPKKPHYFKYTFEQAGTFAIRNHDFGMTDDLLPMAFLGCSGDTVELNIEFGIEFDYYGEKGEELLIDFNAWGFGFMGWGHFTAEFEVDSTKIEVEPIDIINALSTSSYNFSVYPNPSTGIVNVNSQVEFVDVYTIDGMFLITLENTNSLDLTDLDAGVYMLYFNSRGSRGVVKFLKQ